MRRPLNLVLLFITLSIKAQSVIDPGLKAQRWASGLQNPTSMAFLPDGKALILEKATGKVKVMDGRNITGTALDLPVATDSERGLLGIAVSPTFAQDDFVYLYYTAAASDGGDPISNSVKRYSWDGSTLTFGKKVIDLPTTPGPNHDSGKIAFGPDNKLYITIGDLNRNEITSNHDNGVINRIGAVLRINPSGSSVTTNPFYSVNNTGKKKARNDIYAYGIRNTFGIDFDPVTGTPWMTENGPQSFDEINRVTPGFNGGWDGILGPLARNGHSAAEIVSLGERAYYGDPKFSWTKPVAPTDAFFLPTARLGSQYRNDQFVATFKDGRILRFDLSPSRKTLALDGALADAVADNGADLAAEQASLLFGQGFGSITDLTYGPGGMYVLRYDNGIVYRITTNVSTQALAAILPEPVGSALIVMTLLSLGSRRRG